MQVFNLGSGRDASIDNSGASSSVFGLFFDELFDIVPSLTGRRSDGVDFAFCFPSSEGTERQTPKVLAASLGLTNFGISLLFEDMPLLSRYVQRIMD